MLRIKETLFRFFPIPKYIDRVYPALDISQTSMKCIVAKRYGVGLLPIQFEECNIPKETIVDGEIKDMQSLVSELVQLKKKMGDDRLDRAIVSLPEEFAYIFPAVVKARTPQEQKLEIEFAMSEHVPIPLDSVVYTFEKVRPGLVSVIAYDARVGNVYEQALSMAGIQPVAFVPHIVASARVHCPVPGMSHYVLDIGRTRSSIALVYEGFVLGSATVYMGSYSFIERLQGTGMMIEDVVRALQEKGIDADPVLRPAWDTFVQALVPYVSLWREGKCNETVSVPPPTALYVCGGFASTPGVVDALTNDLQVPVQPTDVWSRLFSVEEAPPQLHERESYRYTSAAGLLLANL